PGSASSACEAVPTLFEFRNIALDPAHYRRMGQRNPAFDHHFHEIAKAELEPEIPPDAEDDDLEVEMAALEKILNVQHSGSRPPKGCSHQICRLFAVCTRTIQWVVDTYGRAFTSNMSPFQNLHQSRLAGKSDLAWP